MRLPSPQAPAASRCRLTPVSKAMLESHLPSLGLGERRKAPLTSCHSLIHRLSIFFLSMATSRVLGIQPNRRCTRDEKGDVNGDSRGGKMTI